MYWYTLFMRGSFRNSRLLVKEMYNCYLEIEGKNNTCEKKSIKYQD